MIYFDNAATTKPDFESVERAKSYLFDNFYNPSALYAEGYQLNKELRAARENLVSLVADVQNFTLEFTSCGTESDNHAVFGGARRGNIVTTLGEHSAVFAAVNELKCRGSEVRFARLNPDGSVNSVDLLSLVDDKTSLVAVIHVNNETGAINDVNSIAAAVKRKNKSAYFHADGVQAFGKIPFKLSKDIDTYAVSAHKIGGAKGCGALIKKKNITIRPFVFGGGQESGQRSGTENVFGVKLFEFAAVKRYSELKSCFERVKEVRETLWSLLDKELFTLISPENGSPYILTVAARGVRGETILHEVNDKGLIIGTGSACSSNEKKRHSRVIAACGIDGDLLDGVLRLSFSPENTVEEAKKAAEILNSTVANRKTIMD